MNVRFRDLMLLAWLTSCGTQQPLSSSPHDVPTTAWIGPRTEEEALKQKIAWMKPQEGSQWLTNWVAGNKNGRIVYVDGFRQHFLNQMPDDLHQQLGQLLLRAEGQENERTLMILPTAFITGDDVSFIYSALKERAANVEFLFLTTPRILSSYEHIKGALHQAAAQYSFPENEKVIVFGDPTNPLQTQATWIAKNLSRALVHPHCKEIRLLEIGQTHVSEPVWDRVTFQLGLTQVLTQTHKLIVERLSFKKDISLGDRDLRSLSLDFMRGAEANTIDGRLLSARRWHGAMIKQHLVPALGQLVAEIRPYLPEQLQQKTVLLSREIGRYVHHLIEAPSGSMDMRQWTTTAVQKYEHLQLQFESMRSALMERRKISLDAEERNRLEAFTRRISQAQQSMRNQFSLLWFDGHGENLRAPTKHTARMLMQRSFFEAVSSVFGDSVVASQIPVQGRRSLQRTEGLLRSLQQLDLRRALPAVISDSEADALRNGKFGPWDFYQLAPKFERLRILHKRKK